MKENLCRSCGKKPEAVRLAFMPRTLCKGCFLENIERRVRKNIRQNYLIKPHDRLIIQDAETINGAVLTYLLKSIGKNIPIQIVKTKGNKTFLPQDLMDCSIIFMEEVLFDKKKKILKNPVDVIHPEEIRLFAEFAGLKYKKNKKISKEDKQIEKLLLGLEKRYPSILFGIRNSSDAFKLI